MDSKTGMIKSRITIIGDGSWATALMKMLLAKGNKPGWFVREKPRLDYILEHKRNPDYLPSLELDTEAITFYNDLNSAVQNSEILLFVIPSVYLKSSLTELEGDLSDKHVISAIKGIVPIDNILIADYFKNTHKVNPDRYAVISGPSHAEEVAMEKLTYLTIAAGQNKFGREIAELLNSSFIKTIVTEDVYGTEYAAALKNVMAIAAGICQSLNYGDNFQAVLISNAIQEIDRFLNRADPRIRDTKASACLGDLLVTAYSQFSRNRTFGAMIGKGYSVNSTVMEMNMVAEGYHAVKCIKHINRLLLVNMPITDAVYNILYEKISPGIEIRLLTEHIS